MMIAMAPPRNNRKRPPGRPRTTWLNTIQHNLTAYNLGRLQFSGGGLKVAWLALHSHPFVQDAQRERETTGADDGTVLTTSY